MHPAVPYILREISEYVTDLGFTLQEREEGQEYIIRFPIDKFPEASQAANRLTELGLPWSISSRGQIWFAFADVLQSHVQPSGITVRRKGTR